MVRLEDMKDDSLELLDDELRKLGAYIAEELRRREKEKEDQAREKVMVAIQDFLAAGFSLQVKGEVECERDDWADYRSVCGEVGGVEIENDEVVLNFIEQE